MKTSILLLSLAIVTLMFVCALPGLFNCPLNDTVRADAAIDSGIAYKIKHRQVQDAPGTIVGSKNPELIPDTAAHTMLFLVLADRNSGEERNKARAYLGRFRLSESDMEAILAAANDYHRRVAVFSDQAKTIKDKYWPKPAPEVFVELRELQTKKERLLDEITSSLHRKVTPAGRQTIQNQIIPYVKARMKVTPEPRTLPGGEDWQPNGRISKVTKEN
jgi:hypothetical protein